MSTIIARPSAYGGSTSSAGGNTITGVAAENISGHRVVAMSVSDVVYASSDDITRLPVGVSTGSALVGSPVTIQYDGEMVEPSWNWTVNAPVFMGVGGVLTQTPPTTGLLVVIGTPISQTRLLVQIGEITLLG